MTRTLPRHDPKPGWMLLGSLCLPALLGLLLGLPLSALPSPIGTVAPIGISVFLGLAMVGLTVAKRHDLIEHALCDFPLRGFRHFDHFVLGEDSHGVAVGIEAHAFTRHVVDHNGVQRFRHELLAVDGEHGEEVLGADEARDSAAPGGVQWSDLAAKLQSDWAQIGVTVNIKQVAQSELLAAYREQKGQLVLILWGPDFADPIFRLGNDYSKGIILGTGYIGQRTPNGLVTCLTDGHPGVSGGGVLDQRGQMVGIPIGRMQGDYRFSFILPLRREMFRKVPGMQYVQPAVAAAAERAE